jgi:type IV secretion system protein VirD4
MAWFGKGQGTQGQPPMQVPDREKHHGWRLADQAHPAEAVRQWRETGMRGVNGQPVYSHPQWRMHLGFRDAILGTSAGIPWSGRGNGWTWTQEQTHVLVLGPPRTPAGKSAAVMIPIVLSQYGPVVTLSTKRDIYRATAMARVREGRLWWYAPDGDVTGVPPSVRLLTWSPVVGAGDWDTALQTTRAFMSTAPVGEGTTDASHWRARAEDLLAPMLHWAALGDLEMADCLAAVQDFERKGPTAADDLERWGSPAAARMLRGVLHTPERERGSVVSAAQTALRAYRRPPVLASTRKPTTFDVEDFVTGGPDGRRADTIYITATGAQQEEIAPLVVALLDQIRAATYRRHRALEHAGGWGQTARWPVTFVLDELYTLGRLPDLPAMLTEGGSQGLHIVGAIQDMSLLAAR